MSTDRNNAHPGNYGSIVFFCDEAGCSEEHDTEYTTWDYAKDDVKRAGWYVMPDPKGGWLHLCPGHGKERWVAQQEAKKPAPDQSALPPFMRDRP